MQAQITNKPNYGKLIKNIGKILEQGRKQAYTAVNIILLQTYWQIGKEIINFEQKGQERAEYGTQLLEKLSADLKINYGKGFSRRNVLDMRRFYLFNKKWQTVSAKLSWSQYVELLHIDNDLERKFYQIQSEKEKWSVRELKRQINSALFQRLALRKDKQNIIKLSKEGNTTIQAQDMVKDPYILEFLKIPENYDYSERELEQKIIDNLQMFLLELGKGFSFVARQYRITLGNKHYYVDLVFYNRILKCFVLIDLKIGGASHHDVGQMNTYLNYFKKEEQTEGDQDPIGIILAAGKDDFEIEFALGSITNKLFVSKYKLYLPNKKELIERLQTIQK